MHTEQISVSCEEQFTDDGVNWLKIFALVYCWFLTNLPASVRSKGEAGWIPDTWRLLRFGVCFSVVRRPSISISTFPWEDFKDSFSNENTAIQTKNKIKTMQTLLMVTYLHRPIWGGGGIVVKELTLIPWCYGQLTNVMLLWIKATAKCKCKYPQHPSVMNSASFLGKGYIHIQWKKNVNKINVIRTLLP